MACLLYFKPLSHIYQYLQNENIAYERRKYIAHIYKFEAYVFHPCLRCNWEDKINTNPVVILSNALISQKKHALEIIHSQIKKYHIN